MVETASRVLSTNGAAPVDPLESFRAKLSWEKERYKEFPADHYIEGVLAGVYPRPLRNAAELLVKALTVRTPLPHPAGYTEYPTFSERDDQLAIKGIPRTIEALMRYLRAEARLNTRDRIAVIVAPTGAGKSTIIDVVVRELEAYTEKAEPAPVYGIVGCPINEEPLHVIDQETRSIWKNKYGLEITGQLCPHCKLIAEEKFWRGNLGFKTDGISKTHLPFEVHAIPFSLALGRAITRLESNVTNLLTPNAGRLTPEVILGSNRGLLHIPEFGKQNPLLLTTLNDFFRGRRYSRDVQIFELDNVIIADMTLPEWEEFRKDPANQSLIERMEVIHATYPLDPKSELDIVRKRIFTSQLTDPPHFSPRALEDSSQWAVRTRYRRPTDGKAASEATKAKLYSGHDADGFTQQDRKEIEAEGRKANEGVVGISPPAFWKIVSKLIGEQVSQAEEKDGDGCVDFVELRKRIEEYIEQTSTLSSSDREQMKNQLKAVAEGYDQWLLRTVEQAFQDRYPERANRLLQDYLDESELVLKNQKKVDPRTKDEIDLDVKFIEEFENAASKEAFASGETGQGKRREFRMQLQNWAGKINKEQKKAAQYTDFFVQFPQFEQGIKALLSKGLDNPRDILKAQAPTKEQAERLTEMQQRLISEYDLCLCCAPKLVDYISRQLRTGKLT